MSAPEPEKKSGGEGNSAEQLREQRHVLPAVSAAEAERQMSRRSRRAFLAAAIASALGGLGYVWLRRPAQDHVFEKVFHLNETIGETVFSSRARSPEFPRNRAGARLNGMEGLSDGFDPAAWKLQVAGLNQARDFGNFSENLRYASGGVDAAVAKNFPGAPVAGVLVTLEEIKALPRVEMTTELKCIEGWSQVVNWTGARFADFAAKYQSAARYVSLVTPDRGYYVGWDMASILHPQTLLCYAMNGAPLKAEHGAPLRLVSTAKYGIKQIKRIGRITFTNDRPPDFWAERGYDWYSGL